MFGLTALLLTIMLDAASVSFVISWTKVNDVRLRVSQLPHVIVPQAQFAQLEKLKSALPAILGL